MTGFGSARRRWAQAQGASEILVEVRSVNGRHLDVRIRQPFGPSVEHELRRRVEARLGRGRVEMLVQVIEARQAAGGDGFDRLGVDEQELHAVVQVLGAIEALARSKQLELGSCNAAEILRFARSSAGREGAEPSSAEAPDFLGDLVEEALVELVRFREREGAALASALAEQAAALASLAAALEQEAQAEPQRAASRLQARIAGLCEGLATSLPPADRIAQEIAVMAAKADVTEELARLRSHLARFGETLAAAPSSGQGRTLEFIGQELVREVTTCGSKLSSSGASARVIEAKTALERIREQVQNVE